MISRPEFERKLVAYRKLNKHQRYGQAVFNLMHDLLPDIADLFRWSHMDPFFNDKVSGAFIEACIRVQPDWRLEQDGNDPMKEVDTE